jgi:hypothetical protein
MKLGGGRYQASTKVKVLSPEISDVSGADSVNLLEGNTAESGMARTQQPDGV